jgi:flagellar biosynthetic protein FliP
MRNSLKIALAIGLFCASACAADPAFAQEAAPGASVALERALDDISGDGQPLSTTLQILIVMGLMTVLPSIILMMTSFTRIIIVLSILRHALGLQQSPPNQVLLGLALFLSMFVMAPQIEQINEQAIAPYSTDEIGLTEAIEKSGTIMHGFMAKQTRQSDLKLFMELSNKKGFESAEDIPFSIMLPAFVTSELKTAFQIGFLVFLPFLIIDLVVAAVLMSLGMMMLSPVIISMPFKLLLFVMIDGWALTMGSLAGSFAT